MLRRLATAALGALRAAGRSVRALYRAIRQTVLLFVHEVRRAPSRVLTLLWLGGMGVFVVKGTLRAHDVYLAEERARPQAPTAPVGDAGEGRREPPPRVDPKRPKAPDGGGVLVAERGDAVASDAGSVVLGALRALDAGRVDLAEAATEPEEDRDAGLAIVAHGYDDIGFDSHSVGLGALSALAVTWPAGAGDAGGDEASTTDDTDEGRLVGLAAVRALDQAWPREARSAAPRRRLLADVLAAPAALGASTAPTPPLSRSPVAPRPPSAPAGSVAPPKPVRAPQVHTAAEPRAPSPRGATP